MKKQKYIILIIFILLIRLNVYSQDNFQELKNKLIQISKTSDNFKSIK